MAQTSYDHPPLRGKGGEVLQEAPCTCHLVWLQLHKVCDQARSNCTEPSWTQPVRSPEPQQLPQNCCHGAEDCIDACGAGTTGLATTPLRARTKCCQRRQLASVALLQRCKALSTQTLMRIQERAPAHQEKKGTAAERLGTAST